MGGDRALDLEQRLDEPMAGALDLQGVEVVEDEPEHERHPSEQLILLGREAFLEPSDDQPVGRGGRGAAELRELAANHVGLADPRDLDEIAVKVGRGERRGRSLEAEADAVAHLAVDHDGRQFGIERLDRALERDDDGALGVLRLADADEVLGQLMGRPVVRHC